MSTKQGVVSYYNPSRGYGYIECTVSTAEGGTWIRRYFLPESQVIFKGVPAIKAGCFTRFEESSRPPRRPDDFPFAARIFIYESEEQAKEIDAFNAIGGVK